MNVRTLAATLTLAMLAPAAWSDEPAFSQLDVDASAMAQHGQQFAASMYSQLRGDEGNVMFSPYSIRSVLTMTMAGAKGMTEREMHAALLLPTDMVHMKPEPGLPQPWMRVHWDQARVHAASKWLAAKLEQTAKQKGITLAIANSIWPAKTFPVRDDFVATLKDNYGISITPVDYPDPGRTTINQWVETKTNNRIKELLKPGMVNHMTVLVLVNAIHFKGDWLHAFDTAETADHPFDLTASETVDVPMMHQTSELRYLSGSNYEAVELPYVGEALAMVVIVPSKVGYLPDVEKDLDLDSLTRRLKEAKPRNVDLYLPRFKFTYERTLNEPLQALGMKQAFTPKANFTGITPGGGIWISLVQHKAFIEVSEEGSEAAAATAVVMTRGAAPADPPLVVRARRPFLFLIRHRDTGEILFFGRVTDPR